MTDPVALPAGVALPREIRSAGPGEQQEYRSALAFERVLLGQLTKAMQATTGGSQAASAATETYKDMLPDAMADALVAGGGVGLASDLLRAMRSERP
ncbi:MAG: rod-binding protein [Thermoleophilia bacterium]